MEIEIVKSDKQKSLKLSIVKQKDGERDVVFLPESRKLTLRLDEDSEDGYRLAGGKAMKILEKEDFETVYIKNSDNLAYILEGILLGSYRFTKYKSKQKEFPVKRIFVEDGEGVDEVVRKTQIIASATNYVKNIVNSMPNEMTPFAVAEIGKKLAEANNLEIDILTGNRLVEENMNALLAVARASSNSPAVVKIAHRPKNAKHKILLIGKGLTYDSGGLSLKPADSMYTMKSDKSGASAVLGILKAISELNINVEVVGFLGLTENMIGGNAYKPDDILVARNGVTIEVKNTDAEGRLVLADVLSYAQDNEKDFDYIVDLATLTGAAIVAVGEFTTLVMGHDKKLKKQMLKAGERSGELMATLPFNRYLEELIESKIADIANAGATRYGGSLTAGLFLNRFIKEENKDKWLHLDIAGPAYVEKDWGYNQYGASGAGVRVLVDFIQNLDNKEKGE